MDNDEEGQAPPPPHQFSDLNEVPDVFKIHRGGRLNLRQVNTLITRAHDMGQWLSHENGDYYYVPDEGRARSEFRAQHELIDGAWVAKGEDKQ